MRYILIKNMMGEEIYISINHIISMRKYIVNDEQVTDILTVAGIVYTTSKLTAKFYEIKPEAL